MALFARLEKLAALAPEKLASLEKVAAAADTYLPAVESFLPPFIVAIESENLPAALQALETFHVAVQAMKAAAPAPAPVPAA